MGGKIMSDPFRKAEPLQQEFNQYEKLGLRENPFPREPTLRLWEATL